MEKLLILFYLDRATGTTSNVGFIVFVQLSLAPPRTGYSGTGYA